MPPSPINVPAPQAPSSSNLPPVFSPSTPSAPPLPQEFSALHSSSPYDDSPPAFLDSSLNSMLHITPAMEDLNVTSRPNNKGKGKEKSLPSTPSRSSSLPPETNKSFMLPPLKDITFPPQPMSADPPTPSDSTYGVLLISHSATTSTATSPVSILPPVTFPQRTWHQITDPFLSTIISFRSTGHVTFHQQLALPNGFSQYENSLYPPEAPDHRRRHRAGTFGPEIPTRLRYNLTPTMPAEAGVLGVKVSIEKKCWKIEAVEVLGGWFIVVLEIVEGIKATTPKGKDKKGKGKAKDARKEKEKEKYTPRQEGVRIKEITEGHVLGRGVRELPLWSWACDMRATTKEAATAAYRESSEEAGSNTDKEKPRQLLSIRVRKDAFEEMGGFEALLAEKISPVGKKLREARASLESVERDLAHLLAALGETNESGSDNTVTQLDAVAEALQAKFAGLMDEGGAMVDAEGAKALMVEYDDMVQKVAELRNLEFVKAERKRTIAELEKEKKDRGAWLGIGQKDWDD